jgi:putative tryptophan/tyrosine transport system substrate-binding protein
MKRRDLIAGALIAVSVARAQAQQTGKVYRIAIADGVNAVSQQTATSDNAAYRTLFEVLRRRGYAEGPNVVVERFSGQGRADYYPELVRDVVRSKPDVILAVTSRLVLDFKAATATIPVVGMMGDPVGWGIVSSLAHPGGNITGVSADAGLEMWGKRIELLKAVAPRVSRAGFLFSRRIWDAPYGAMVREATSKAGVSLIGPPLDAPLAEAEYRRVFAAMMHEGAEALLVGDQPENFTNRRLIVELTEMGRLPAISPYREHVELGGLMAYAYDLGDMGRGAADQVDQILRGTKPGEIPIYQATKFELGINLKTAKALGLTIPSSLLTVADEVIE